MERLIHETTRGIFAVRTYAFFDFDDLAELDPEHAEAVQVGKLEYFRVRIDVMWQGVVLASEFLGGCLYEKAEDFACEQDSHADLIESAVCQAEAFGHALKAVLHTKVAKPQRAKDWTGAPLAYRIPGLGRFSS